MRAWPSSGVGFSTPAASQWARWRFLANDSSAPLPASTSSSPRPNRARSANSGTDPKVSPRRAFTTRSTARSASPLTRLNPNRSTGRPMASRSSVDSQSL